MRVPGDSGQTALVAFVLDESGSMHGLKGDTIGGVNQYFKSLRKETPEALVTLALFSSRGDQFYRPLCSAVRLQDVPELTDENYMPSGGTPLRDAIGKAITEAAAAKADKYIVVVMTDGQENDSKEYSHEAITALMLEKQALDNWTVVFLGSTLRAVEQFRQMGGQHTNSMFYAASQDGTRATFSSLGRASGQTVSSPMGSTETFFKDAGQDETDYDGSKVAPSAEKKKRAPRKKS